MTPVYFLRPAHPEDDAFLWSLRRQAMRAAVEQAYGPWDDEVQRQLFERGFRLEKTSVIVVNGQPVGRLDLTRSEAELLVGTLELVPAVHGRGLGGAVLRDVLEEARAAGLPVRSRVLKGNRRARRLYQRLGFQVVGEISTHDLMRWPA